MTYPAPMPPDRSRRFLNMSGGVLMTTIAAGLILSVLLACGAFVLFCGFGVYLLPDPNVTPSP